MATRQVVEMHGFAAATVPAVVAAAGASHGTFYHYFSSIDEAVVELLNKVLEPIAALVDAIDPDALQEPEHVRLALEIYYAALGSELQRNGRLLCEALAVAPTSSGPVGKQMSKFLAQLRQRVRAVLSAVNGRPPFRHMDVQVAGSALVGMVVAASQEAAEMGTAFQPQAWAAEMVQMELGAILAPHAHCAGPAAGTSSSVRSHKP